MSIKKILVVDDSPTERQFMLEALSKLGYQVVLAESGEDRVRRHRRVREEITALVLGAVRERLAGRRDELSALADAVLAGDLDAYAAAESLA